MGWAVPDLERAPNTFQDTTSRTVRDYRMANVCLTGCHVKFAHVKFAHVVHVLGSKHSPAHVGGGVSAQKTLTGDTYIS
jgi:hypothetical protein